MITTVQLNQILYNLENGIDNEFIVGTLPELLKYKQILEPCYDTKLVSNENNYSTLKLIIYNQAPKMQEHYTGKELRDYFNKLK